MKKNQAIQAIKTHILFVILCVLIMFIGFSAVVSASDELTSWTHLSSENGDIPEPGEFAEQTSSLIFDVNLDGTNDFIITRRDTGPTIVWYQRSTTGWNKYVIDNTFLHIEAGGAFYDIDGDNDLDIVFGGDWRSNQVYWWENPYPNYDSTKPWTRYEIKNSGENKHHDEIFGDFDGDGEAELVFWNQNANKLFIADIPSDPKNTQPWPYTEIWSSGTHAEGISKGDIDHDGKIDILAGGRWFKHNGGTDYIPYLIDDSQRDSRIAVGDLNEDGVLEVVMVPGDEVGRLKWYECTGDPTEPSSWTDHDLLDFDVDHGHSLAIADFNSDGKLDIFNGEMNLDDTNPDAKMWIFLGDGNRNFQTQLISEGIGNHESKVGDLDGDGDVDILGKPFNWDIPRIDIWLNNGSKLSLDLWERHVIDPAKPETSLFIASEDINGDNMKDIITGGWWYTNPGSADGDWVRHDIGLPLRNMASSYDFDGDGDIDILGTEGFGAENNPNFSWARNDGAGNFTILNNIENGDGNFMQGVAVEHFQDGNPIEVALSWHDENIGVQMLTVPTNPSTETWNCNLISETSQGEALTAGDINNDGDLDLLIGTKWLDNDGSAWTATIIDPTNELPDRNSLADINNDGLLDAIVCFEGASDLKDVVWYEQTASTDWIKHVIATVIGPMSLDVADMDGDGDYDIVVGEHNVANPASARLYIFENLDGIGENWEEHIIYTGDEHHDGTQLVDIDDDGDLDIISIGWDHERVLLYENKAIQATSSDPPVITIHPASQTVAEGNTATFSIVATGTAPLSYQWQQDGENISGATSTSYTTSATTISDNGTTYRCIVTNDLGTVTSDQAVLNVYEDTSSPQIDLWYGNYQKFGDIGVPQQWVNILGNVYDSSGIASLNYSLNGGSAQPLSTGPDNFRLQSSGDFNVEINVNDLNDSNNSVVIRATDHAGNTKNEEVTVNYSCNNIWPETYSINWNSVTNIQDSVQVVDGLWTKEPNSIRPSIIGYDRVVAMGDITWDDYEVTVPITINTPMDSSVIYGPNVGIIMRWQGHYDVGGEQPRNGWWPLGALGLYKWVPELKDYRLRIIGNNMHLIANDDSAKQLDVGVTYMFKMRAETIGTNTLYSLKVWEQVEDEPSEWTISGYGAPGELKNGSVMLASYYVNASFGDVTIRPEPFDDPLVISNVETIVDASSATIRWDTNELATSKVAYGPSIGYEHGSIVDTTLVTSHSITLASLTPGSNYHYQINSTDEGGNPTSTSDLNFNTLQDPTNIISDDFNASTLNTSLWTEFNPESDSIFEIVGTGNSDALLSITVPAGISHNIWTNGNSAPRIMQAAGNTDFEIEVKFESQLTSEYQVQGVIVQQDNSNYLLFDFIRDATNTRVFAASFTEGTPTPESDVKISPGNPLYLRVKRQGDQWTQSYSYDGTSWTEAADFSHALTVTSVGPFVGNHGVPESSSPAFIGLIDYFFNSASPIIPEDAGDTTPPAIIDCTPTGTNVPVSSQINVTFSEAMDQASAESAFSTSPVTAGSFSWNGKTMTYTPDSDLTSDTTYTVTIGTGAMDIADNNMQAEHTWSFTTGSTIISDETPPTIISVTLNDTVVQTGAPIEVTVNATDDNGIANVTANETLLTLTGTHYVGTITAGTGHITVIATDKAGNLAENTSATYTIDDTEPELILKLINEGNVNTLYINSSEPLSKCTVDNVECTDSSSKNWSETLNNGTHNIIATDLAGNEALRNLTLETGTIEPTNNNQTNYTYGKVTLNITTTLNVTESSNITICEYDENPVGSVETTTLSLLGINKFVQIEVDPDLNASIEKVRISINYSGADLTEIDVDSLKLHVWNDSIKKWEELEPSGIDKVKTIVWGELNHISLFSILGEKPEDDNDGNGGSSSSSSGGGGTSGELYEIIACSETDRQYVSENSDISYSFEMECNIVQYVNFTGLTNTGKIASKVEILKDTSALVDNPPSDIVYKNMNIWVGNAGWATNRNIADATVIFTVDKSWITKNNIDESSITLYRYSDNTWHKLVTRKIAKDANSLQFEAETSGFSHFTVTGKTIVESGGEGIIEPTETAEKTPVPTATDKKGIPGFGLFAGFSVLLIAVQLLHKKK